MKILYVTQWFEPEPVFKGLGFAKALSARGHDVEVVTGFPNYPAGKIYPGYKMSLCTSENIDGIPVHRLPLYPSHDASSIGRMLNYLSFSVTVAIFLLFRARRFDVIYAYSPVTIGLGAVLGAFLSGKPVVTDVQDLWPDSVLNSKMRGTRYMQPVLQVICSLVYRRCAKIISQSNGIRDRLIERGVPAAKVSVIYNWADEQATVTNGTCDLAPYKLDGRFNIVYGGNLGRAQGLNALIRAAAIASNEVSNVHLLLVGDGMERSNLEALVRTSAIANVTIAPSVPQAMIGDIFAAADVLVLHLNDSPLFEITIPSKLQFYLAMGKPILAGLKGEAANLVTDVEAGLSVPPQNDRAIADAMIEFAKMPSEKLRKMGQNAHDAYWRSFSCDVGISAIEGELNVALAQKSQQ